MWSDTPFAIGEMTKGIHFCTHGIDPCAIRARDIVRFIQDRNERRGAVTHSRSNMNTIKQSKSALLFVTSLATFSGSLLSTAVNIALPSISAEFSMEAHLLGWVATSFLLASAVTTIPVGRVSDIYGRKKIFLLGLVVFIFSSLLCTAANSPALLIAWRTIQGIGGSMIWGPSVSLLTSSFPANERGKAIGINTASVYCGLSVGPFWGGFLTASLGWRSIFFSTAILFIAAAIVTFWKVKGDWMESRGEKLDANGSLALMISLILTIYGFSSIPTPRSIPFIVLGLTALYVFYRIETRTLNPVLNVNMFRDNRVFVFSLLSLLIVYCGVFAPNFLLSLYFQYNLALSPQTAGAILVIQPGIMVFLAPVAGRASDRIDPLKVAIVGMGITCLALVLYAFLTDHSPLWHVLLGVVVMGSGFGLFASPVTTAVMSSVGKEYFGVAAGTQATMRHTGQVLSMGIVMILFAILIGDVQITPEYYAKFLLSMKISFVIFAVLCFTGIWLLLAGSKSRKA